MGGTEQNRTDLEELLAARAGDEDSARRFVERHAPVLRRVARSLVGDAALADDAAQEAFVAALTTEALPHGDVGAWLRSVAARKALDAVRARRRRPEAPLPEPSQPWDEPAAPAADPGTALDLRAAMGRLSPSDRALVTMVDALGCSLAEAASALGIGPLAVKMRVHRARLRLRRLLQEGARAGERE